MFKHVEISAKKWYCVAVGFMFYVTVGAFLMYTFDMSDAMHLAEPLLDDTPLTIWVMAPMYAVAYAIILFVVEIMKHKKENKA